MILNGRASGNGDSKYEEFSVHFLQLFLSSHVLRCRSLLLMVTAQLPCQFPIAFFGLVKRRAQEGAVGEGREQ